MDLTKPRISAAFIGGRTLLTWREVCFGLQHELLAPRAPVDFALEALRRSESPTLEQLAGSESEPLRELVQQLADSEPEQIVEAIRDKWLYLVLAWVWEHRRQYPDPLQTVEEIYADFGYPEQIAGFVRYMPAEGPHLGSRELNEKRLYEKWSSYLVKAASQYAVPR